MGVLSIWFMYMPTCIVFMGVDYSEIVTDGAAEIDGLVQAPVINRGRMIATERHKGKEEESTRWVEGVLIWSRRHSAQTLPPWFAWRHYRRLATVLSVSRR